MEPFAHFHKPRPINFYRIKWERKKLPPLPPSLMRTPIPPIDRHAPEKDMFTLVPYGSIGDGIADMGGRGIRKPVGEVGRPGRGGYNLQNALKWEEPFYKQVQTYVHEKARSTLDISLSFTKQNETLVKAICIQASSRYVPLRRYEDHWPVKDMLRLYLKHTSEKHRTTQKTNSQPSDNAGNANSSNANSSNANSNNANSGLINANNGMEI